MFFLIFIFGLLFGSFLNVVIYWLESKAGDVSGQVIPATARRPKSKKMKDDFGQARMTRKSLNGRSFCPSCKHQLGFFDLIPLFSWIFLRAKCRYCKEKISIQYPLVELGTGLIFVMTYWLTAHTSQFTGLSGQLSPISLISYSPILLLLIINCLLLIIFVYDLKHKIIPDKVIYPAIVLAVCSWLFAVVGGYLNHTVSLATTLYPILAAFGAGSFFYLLAAVSDGKWMGGGDIKLVFLMGLLLGFPNILIGLFLGFVLGAIFGVTLMVSRKAKLQSEIPFGPFLITGTWIALFWGDKVVQLYVRAFLY